MEEHLSTISPLSIEELLDLSSLPALNEAEMVIANQVAQTPPRPIPGSKFRLPDGEIASYDRGSEVIVEGWERHFFGSPAIGKLLKELEETENGQAIYREIFWEGNPTADIVRGFLGQNPQEKNKAKLYLKMEGQNKRVLDMFPEDFSLELKEKTLYFCVWSCLNQVS